MGIMGEWHNWGKAPEEGNKTTEERVAAKMQEKLQKDLGELAPTRVEVASHGGKDPQMGDYVLFNFHYDNKNAQEGYQAMNHGWVKAAFECGGHGSTCLPHGDNLIQASIQGVSLERLERELDKREKGIGRLR